MRVHYKVYSRGRLRLTTLALLVNFKFLTQDSESNLDPRVSFEQYEQIVVNKGERSQQSTNLNKRIFELEMAEPGILQFDLVSEGVSQKEHFSLKCEWTDETNLPLSVHLNLHPKFDLKTRVLDEEVMISIDLPKISPGIFIEDSGMKEVSINLEMILLDSLSTYKHFEKTFNE